VRSAEQVEQAYLRAGERITAGRTADAVHSEAVADADRAFALLRDGTGA